MAGILLESQTAGDMDLAWLVLGIGVNIAAHPAAMEYPATSLAAAGAGDVAPAALLEAVAAHLLAWYRRWHNGEGFAEVRAAWLARAHRLGSEIRVRLPREEISGRFAGLDVDGRLLLDGVEGPSAHRRRRNLPRRLSCEGRAMLLAINANNTNTVFAVWEGEQLRGVWRAATDGRRTADEYVVWLDHLLALDGLSRDKITGTIIASVVPEANFNLRRLCRDYCRSEPVIVGAPGVTLGTTALVEQPGEVGADRLVNTVAAHHRYKGPLIIVDFGTATTFDVVDGDAITAAA